MRYDDDHAFWAGYLAASIATAVRNTEAGYEPADVTTCLRRDLMPYLRSSDRTARGAVSVSIVLGI
jgi:hypothetical protein